MSENKNPSVSLKKGYNPDEAPKKRPFSMQLDVAAFEPATDGEKVQQETMRESTT